MNRVNAASAKAIASLKKTADKAGLSLTELSLGWVAGQPGVTSPIIGARSPEQLEQAAKACHVQLSDKTKAEIDKIVPPHSHIVEYYRADFGPGKKPL